METSVCQSKFTPMTIAVLPELSRLTTKDLESISGVCTDYPMLYSEVNLSHLEKIYYPVPFIIMRFVMVKNYYE
jgi:hypothetical protein